MQPIDVAARFSLMNTESTNSSSTYPSWCSLPPRSRIASSFERQSHFRMDIRPSISLNSVAYFSFPRLTGSAGDTWIAIFILLISCSVKSGDTGITLTPSSLSGTVEITKSRGSCLATASALVAGTILVIIISGKYSLSFVTTNCDVPTPVLHTIMTLGCSTFL